jgi:hypothetical protein
LIHLSEWSSKALSKTSILDQAYKGRFAVSDSSDEAAELLLKHVAEEKAALEKVRAPKRRGARAAAKAKPPVAASDAASRLAAPSSTAPVPNGAQGAFELEYAK